MNNSRFDVVVVGAGVSGATAAALLAADGARAVMLEHHTIVGGCASYFQRAGYRFDVGATVAGGFGPRGLHARVASYVDAEIEVARVDPAMVVHVPGERVARYGDARWKTERARVFGPAAEGFWRDQEAVADLAWDLAARLPALPRDAAGLAMLARAFRPAHAALLPRLGRSTASRLPRGDGSPAARRLRRFVDAQLLITAQGDAAHTDWLYGATALDLAREGTYHVAGGIASIAVSLVRAFRRHGGTARYGETVVAIECDPRGGEHLVRTASGNTYAAERVIAAIPPANVAALLAPATAARFRRGRDFAPGGYGAFCAYVGLPPGVVPADFPAHHQVVLDESGPMGEGRTAFLSFSDAGETARARDGGRAVTLSTHTDVAAWEEAYRAGDYGRRKAEYGARLLAVLDSLVPGAAAAARVVEFATPHTFERYTGRAGGYVGGAPQLPWRANLLAPSHVSGVPGLVLCGDSVFPGQSTVGAAMSGVTAARVCGSSFA